MNIPGIKPGKIRKETRRVFSEKLFFQGSSRSELDFTSLHYLASLTHPPPLPLTFTFPKCQLPGKDMFCTSRATGLNAHFWSSHCLSKRRFCSKDRNKQGYSVLGMCQGWRGQASHPTWPGLSFPQSGTAAAILGGYSAARMRFPMISSQAVALTSSEWRVRGAGFSLKIWAHRSSKLRSGLLPAAGCLRQEAGWGGRDAGWRKSSILHW